MLNSVECVISWVECGVLRIKCPIELQKWIKGIAGCYFLYIPIIDATDRIVSKVNAVPDGEFPTACVIVADVSKVNAEACVELPEACVKLPEACVELAEYDEVVPIPCVGFAVGDDKLPESSVWSKMGLFNKL